jgi:hypothetical protein
MSFDAVIKALAIPREAFVDRRVPKKLLIEQGAPTSADRRRIIDGIEELHWVAALKPTNIGVPAFKDEEREYLEISVLTAVLRAAAKPARLIELIHRAVPYPLLLITEHDGSVALSVAHKRWSQSEGAKIVIEDVSMVPLSIANPTPQENTFLEDLAISKLPARNLNTLYTGWHDRFAALEAARITGNFRLPDSPESSVAIQESLVTHARLKRDLAILRAKADKEKQINRRVELNTEIKRLEAEMAANLKNL